MFRLLAYAIGSCCSGLNNVAEPRETNKQRQHKESFILQVSDESDFVLRLNGDTMLRPVALMMLS